MARPTTKQDLIQIANEKFSQLQLLINTFPIDKQETDFSFNQDFLEKKKEAHWQRDKNLRDVLIHLYEWHQLLLNWIQRNNAGISSSFLPTPYNWRNYAQMNEEFIRNHQETSLQSAKESLEKSHLAVMKQLKQYTNEQLFAKKQFSWTGSTTLGSYFVSSTSSHYDWAIKKLKQVKKQGSF